MNWKKVFVMLVCFTLVWPFLTGNSGVSAAPQIELDQIKLQQSPYQIGEGWTVDASYSSEPPYAMAIGNKEYLAVGPYGSVIRSTDGRNWKALSKFANYQLTAIAWDGSKYVMFGANTEYENQISYTASEAFVSKDGLEWNKLDFEPGEAIHNLIWGNNEFVAIGMDHVFTSSDGVNWTKTQTHQLRNGYHNIAYVHDTYFLYGYEEKKLYTSKDGRKWTTNKLDTKADIRQMIWSKNQYVGVGNGIYTSKNGITWTKQKNSPANAYLQSIYTDGKLMIAVGHVQNKGTRQQVAYTSKDGMSWKKTDLSGLHADIYALYPVKGGFAGIGSKKTDGYADGSYAIFTADGVKWSYKLIGTSFVGEFTGVATDGKRTVAVGHQGSVVYTDNGVKWHSANPFSWRDSFGRTSLHDVVWGANKFVAVGSGGVYTSTNGVSWKKEKVAFKDQYGQLSKILWTGKFFVASDQSYGVYTSKDGVSWSKVESVSKWDYWLQSMIWDGKRVVGAFQVYNNGNQYIKIMQTTDGKKWTELGKLNVIVVDLAWNGKSYVAADPYNASNIWTSKDAKKWTKAKVNLNSNDNFNFISSVNGQFFGFNNTLQKVNGEYVTYDAYYVSKDGVTWKEVPTPSKFGDVNVRGDHMMNDWVKAHGKYIFVGANGLIMYTNQLDF